MNEKIINKTDMCSFLKRHDLIWEKKPKAWDEGPFIGSGLTGATLYFNGKNRLVLNIGDTGIYDNRKETGREKNPLFLTPRLPIGEFSVGGVSRSGASMRLDLYNARACGRVETIGGAFSYTCFAPHGKRLIVFEATEEGAECRFDWTPGGAESPRQRRLTKLKSDRASADYPPPKKAYSYQHRDTYYCIQPLFSGGCYAVAYRIVRQNNTVRLFLTVGQGTAENIVANRLAYELDNAVDQYETICREHLDYWHSFYEKSFVSLNDTEIEEFYWIQLYKLASAGCENGRVYDTCGPWLTNNTAWPGTWWNLNVELTYSPLFASNHTELVRPLTAALKNGMDELIRNVPAPYRHDSAALGRETTETMRSPVPVPTTVQEADETGDLLWALHSVWLKYRMTQDSSLLVDLFYPLLRRAVEFYLHFLERDEACILHIPPTLSPEFPVAGPDASYDLALLKWGLATLIRIADGKRIYDAKREEWQWVLDHLADYPIDPVDGIQIADGVPYDRSHRHYSHLLMIYPLHTLDLNDPKNRQLAETSIRHWLSKPDALQGYSHTGAAGMFATLGDGREAYRRLKLLWEDGFIRPNTMYHENGSPVLETPPAAACSILDMLIQSWGDTIRIFPALPDEWRDITVRGLLCEGGFEVSAVMRGGDLLWCSVDNVCSAEGICTIRAPFTHPDELTLYADGDPRPVVMPPEGLRARIPLGKSLILARPTVRDFTVEPISDSEDGCHIYGFNRNSMY